MSKSTVILRGLHISEEGLAVLPGSTQTWAQAQKFDGKCNLRFDDTNPESEKQDLQTVELGLANKSRILFLGCC